MQGLIISLIFFIFIVSNLFIYPFLFNFKKINENNIDKIVLLYNLLCDIILFKLSYITGYIYIIIILFFVILFRA